jgi:hypothetical protein
MGRGRDEATFDPSLCLSASPSPYTEREIECTKGDLRLKTVLYKASRDNDLPFLRRAGKGPVVGIRCGLGSTALVGPQMAGAIGPLLLKFPHNH